MTYAHCSNDDIITWCQEMTANGIFASYVTARKRGMRCGAPRFSQVRNEAISRGELTLVSPVLGPVPVADTEILAVCRKITAMAKYASHKQAVRCGLKNCGRDRFEQVRDSAVERGELRLNKPTAGYRAKDANHPKRVNGYLSDGSNRAATVAPCDDQVASRSGDGLIVKTPWRPIWASNWPDAQVSRLQDVLDAVHDFRAAWRHLHRPFKEQNVVGLNRDQHKQRPPRITNGRWGNPIERYLDAPASHPRGQGI